MKVFTGVILALLRICFQSGLIVLLVYFLVNSLASPIKSQEEYFSKDDLETNLPAFYFSVLPRWYDPYLALLPATPAKEQGVSLMRQGWSLRDWLDFRQYVDALSAEYTSNSVLASMRYEKDLTQLKADYSLFASKITDVESKLYLDSIQSILFQKKAIAVFDYLPVIHFWGKQNRAHQLLQELWNGNNEQKFTILFSALKWSVVLTIYTLFFAIIIGTFIAFVIMRRQFRNPMTFPVKLSKAIINFVYLVPVFGIAALTIPVFTTDWVSPYLHWFPGVGSYLVNSPGAFHFDYFLFPALIMAIPISASLSLRWLAGFDAELSRQYILVLRSKGLTEKTIIVRHILYNLVIPVIVYISMLIPALISGALVIENIFAIPGLGRLTLQSIKRQDEPMLLMITAVIAILSLIGVNIAGKLIPLFDPRVEKFDKTGSTHD